MSLFLNNIYAYTLTQNDTNIVNSLTQKIESLIEKKWENYRNKFIKELNKLSIKYSKNERLKTIIDEIVVSLSNDNQWLEKMLLEWVNSDNITNNGNSNNNDKIAKKIEISDLTTWIFNLTCLNTITYARSEGTAFLMKIQWKNTIFTNMHVFEWMNKCWFWVYTTLSDNPWTWIIVKFDPTTFNWYNTFSDFWMFNIPSKILTFDEEKNNNWIVKNYISLWAYWEENWIPENTNLVDKLNYNISSLSACSSKVSKWTKVFVIWYPSFWVTETDTEIKWYWKVKSVSNEQIITDWIISWYYNETSSNDASKNIYPYENYYVSNKMDSWNSWWPAIAEENWNLCLLWIATWVNTWNFDNQGIIQNINNIYYTK